MASPPPNKGALVTWNCGKTEVHPEQPVSVQRYLEDYPNAIYTASRTIDQWNVLEYEEHIARLAQISSLDPTSGPLPFEVTESLISEIFEPGIVAVISALISIDPHSEYRLTLLVYKRPRDRNVIQSSSKEGNSLNMCDQNSSDSGLVSPCEVFVQNYATIVLGEILKLPPPSAVTVDIAISHRENPTVKHTNWVLLRSKLEEHLSIDSNEMLLRTRDGAITEGLSSNFMVVLKNGQIMTAPDSAVLSGTIRRMAIAACKQFNITVIYKCPSIADIRTSWKAAAIMSTSRLILPIRLIRDFTNSESWLQNDTDSTQTNSAQNDGVVEYTLDSENDETIAKILSWIKNHLPQACTNFRPPDN